MPAGGKREGAGRKTVAEEEKSKALMREALKLLYRKDGDDENTILFIKDFAETSKGQQFIAEHLLGKPKENLNLTGDVSILPIQWVESE
jgi:hypothetical protein